MNFLTKKFQTYLLAFLVIALVACRSFGFVQRPSNDFLHYLNNNQVNNSVSPSLNGLYHLVEFDKSSKEIETAYTNFGEGIIAPIYFYGNHLIKARGTFYFDCSSINREFYSFKDYPNSLLDSKLWGVWSVSDSMINAICYTIFASQSSIWNCYYLCHYQGKLDGKDRIVDWHMVPPYPELTEFQLSFGVNLRQLEYLKAKKTFVFQKFPIKTALDSNKVWINRYKTNN